MKVEQGAEVAKEEYVGHAGRGRWTGSLSTPRCWRGRECKISCVGTCVSGEGHGGHSLHME
jgi:hypothetical protein